MSTRVVVLGAGFGGLELSTMLSESGGFDLTLIDKHDAFVFGYLKLEVMFGRATSPSAALMAEFSERDITLIPGRRVNSIDPARSVAVLDDNTELPFDLNAPSAALVAEKEHFGASRQARWFAG